AAGESITIPLCSSGNTVHIVNPTIYLVTPRSLLLRRDALGDKNAYRGQSKSEGRFAGPKGRPYGPAENHVLRNPNQRDIRHLSRTTLLFATASDGEPEFDSVHHIIQRKL